MLFRNKYEFYCIKNTRINPIIQALFSIIGAFYMLLLYFVMYITMLFLSVNNEITFLAIYVPYSP